MVLLDLPENEVSVPARVYNRQKIFLDGGEVFAVLYADSQKEISVIQDKVTPLKLGIPLTHTIMVAVCFLGILSYYSWSFPEESLVLLVLFVLAFFIMWMGMAATRFFIRKRNTLKDFILQHPVWHLLTSLVIGLIIYSEFFLMGMPIGWGGGIILEGLTVGAGIGIIFYLVLFPFLILTFANSVYRRRLESVFGFEKVKSRPGSFPDEHKEKINP